MTKKSEFTYVVLAEDVTKKRTDITLEPTAEQIENIAKRLDVQDLVLEYASAALKRMDDGCTIYVSGKFAGKVTQECVVSLEPVTSKIEDHFEAYYLDDTKIKSFESAKRQKQVGLEEDLMGVSERRMPEMHEEPEPIRDGKINVGELLIQCISLSLNPYPRKTSEDDGEEEDRVVYADARVSPFSALKDHVTQKKT